MTDLTAAVKDIETKRCRARNGYLFFGLMGIALVVLLFLQSMGAAVVVGVLVLGYYFFLVRPDVKRFNAAYREAAVAASLSRQMEDAAYRGKEGIRREEILAAQLLPIKPDNSCMTFHRVTGTGKGMTLELSDLTFQLEDEGEKARPCFITGCWIRVTLDHSTGRSLRMVGRELVDTAVQRPWFAAHTPFVPAGWEKEELDRLFCSYTKEGEPLSLPDGALECLRRLAETAPESLAFALEGEMLTLFLRRRFVTPGDPGIKIPVTPALLTREYLPELEDILKLAAACWRMDPRRSEKSGSDT